MNGRWEEFRDLITLRKLTETNRSPSNIKSQDIPSALTEGPLELLLAKVGVSPMLASSGEKRLNLVVTFSKDSWEPESYLCSVITLRTLVSERPVCYVVFCESTLVVLISQRPTTQVRVYSRWVCNA